jgi:hypothetical protein
VSIHWRESDSVRTISLWQYPTFTLNNPQWANAEDRPPDPTGSCTSPFSPDGAHQPCFAYIPYLFTGDYYYLEEMYYWASWNIIKAPYDSPSRELHSKGILTDQVRGIAWTFRSFVEVAALAPDNHFEKVYFDSLTKNNLEYHNDRLFGPSPDNTMGWWASYNLRSSYCSSLNSNVTYCTSPFETDFVTIIMDHAVDLGYTRAIPLRDFGLKFCGGRFSGTSGLPPKCGTPYRLPTIVDNIVLDDWADVYAAMGSPASCDLSYPTMCQGYSFIARAALTAASRSDEPGADAAFTWLDGQLDAATVFKDDITFGLMPGPPRTTMVAVENGADGQTDRPELEVYPNPFNPAININYELGITNYELGKIYLKVFDTQGKMVADLSPDIRNSSFVIRNSITWNAAGHPSGVYIIRAKAGHRLLTKKIILQK